MKSNQKGFSVVEILIVIVVVGLLGAGGWLVYDRQKNKTPETSITQSQTNTAANSHRSVGFRHWLDQLLSRG